MFVDSRKSHTSAYHSRKKEVSTFAESVIAPNGKLLHRNRAAGYADLVLRNFSGVRKQSTNKKAALDQAKKSRE